MVSLPDDILQEVFQLLCCPRGLSPDYKGLQRPIGFGQGKGADGIEVVNLFERPKLPTVYQLARVCRAWRTLTAEIPRIWNYQLVVDCRPLEKIYRQLQSGDQEAPSLQRPAQDYLSHPQISQYIHRLDQLLSVRQRCPQEGGRKEPLLLTVTFHGSSIIPLNERLLSTLYRYSPQLARIDIVGGWVLAESLSATAPSSSPSFDPLEELLIQRPSGTGPFSKLLHLSNNDKPEATFPRLHTLVLSEISLHLVTPHFPWAQLTSLSIGAVGLRHTASFDSDPDEIMQTLQLTQSLRYLRIYGRMRCAREYNLFPVGRARTRPLVVLPHLTHLEIHDMDLTILTSHLFTENWSKPSNDYVHNPQPSQPILLGLLCAPALKTFDVYLAESMGHAAWSKLGYSVPPIARILLGFMNDRVYGFRRTKSNEGDNGDTADKERLSSTATILRGTLRIAVVSPSLFNLPQAPSSTTPSKPVIPHIVQGAHGIFRLLVKHLPQPVGGGGTLASLKWLLADGCISKPPAAHPHQPSGPELLVNGAGNNTARQRRVAYLAKIAEYTRNGEGKVYSSDEVELQLVTDDVVSTERFVDRFIKLAPPPQSNPNTSTNLVLDTWGDELEDLGSNAGPLHFGNTYPEEVIREVLRILAWDGILSGEANAVGLDRWLYLLGA